MLTDSRSKDPRVIQIAFSTLDQQDLEIMVEIGQPGRGQRKSMGARNTPYRPATTQPQLPPPHTIISTSSGTVILLWSLLCFQNMLLPLRLLCSLKVNQCGWRVKSAGFQALPPSFELLQKEWISEPRTTRNPANLAKALPFSSLFVLGGFARMVFEVHWTPRHYQRCRVA